jgi:hypothetical protein
MHLPKIKKSILSFQTLTAITVIALSIVLLPASVSAETDIQKVCDGKGKDAHGRYTDSSNISACNAGYKAGKSKAQNKDSVCGSYGSDDKSACYYGFGKGACSVDNPTQKDLNNCLNANPIIGDLNLVVNFLSAGVGIIITGSIIFAGIQYAFAGNNPNDLSAAKKRIENALIALVAFFFIFGFLQYLIPGGLLEGIFK